MRRFPHLRFVWRDLWMGVYVGEREPDGLGFYRTLTVCPLPCIAISLDVRVDKCVAPGDCQCQSRCVLRTGFADADLNALHEEGRIG